MRELPWSDMKVAYGIDDDQPLERWWASTTRNKRKLPTGWSLEQIDGAGARWVAVFRIEEQMPTIADGEAVQRFLVNIRAVAPALAREENDRG